MATVGVEVVVGVVVEVEVVVSQPDGIDRYECPICKHLTPADELLDCSGLCFRCDQEQSEVMVEASTPKEREEENDREEE